MRRILLAGLAAAAATSLSPARVRADQYDTQRAAVKAYAVKALDVYRKDDLQSAIADYMTPKRWFEGPENFSLHVGLATNDQTVLADSGFPELVGLNYNDISDFDGKSLGHAITTGVSASPQGVSLPHRFANPNTKVVAHAEGYCMRVDGDHILCAWSQSTN